MLKNRKFLLLVLILLSALSLTGCSAADEHIWLKSLGWSRALLLGGTAYNEPVPVAINQAGEQFFLLVEKNESTDTSQFRVKALSQDAKLLWDKPLDEFSLHAPKATQLLWLDEELRLFWVDQQQLFTLSMDSSGNLLGAPLLLSGGDVVGSFSVATNSLGAPTLFYAGSNEKPGVHVLTSFDGTQPGFPLDPAGIRIQLRYDQDDILHAGWLRYPQGYGTSEVVYATYPEAGNWDAGEVSVIHQLATGPSNVLVGPTFGIDDNDVYFFWTVTIRSGIEAGTVVTEYLSFPHGDVQNIQRPSQLFMPALSTSMKQTDFPQGYLKVGERVNLQTEKVPYTPEVQELYAAPNVTGELALAFQAPTQHLWRKSKFQVNVAYFSEGEVTSYQPLSYTTTLSSTPYIISDQNGYLYITWLEKRESHLYTVYFASTAPKLDVALGRSTSSEILGLVGEVVFGMLVGILMAPIAGAVWMLAPMFILLLTAPLRKLGSERTRTIFMLLSLVLALASYWVGKFAVLPGIATYVPFSAWVPEMSVSLGNFLRFAVPGIFSVVALGVAWHYTFRQSNQSTLYFLLIYIGVDALLTSSVYAVLIFGGM